MINQRVSGIYFVIITNVHLRSLETVRVKNYPSSERRFVLFTLVENVQTLFFVGITHGKRNDFLFKSRRGSKEMSSEKVISPKTGRLITVGGAAYNSLTKTQQKNALPVKKSEKVRRKSFPKLKQMGGHLNVHTFSVVEETPGYEGPPKISSKVKKVLCEKFGLPSFPLTIDPEDGVLRYDDHEDSFKVYHVGIDIFISIILHLSKELKRTITGSFNYTFDQSGGTYFGTAYIFPNHGVAIEYEVTSRPTEKSLAPVSKRKIKI